MAVAFADFVRGLRHEDIPEDVRRIMRRSFLDTIGVAAIGSTTANSAIARRGADALWRSSPDVGSARMLLNGRRVSPAGAAFRGAATIDAIDAHDGSTPARGHAGSAVFPSLLAMVDAQASLGQRLDGRALLTLLAIGYETSYRAGLTQHATCADYHTSGAWTAVGVAAKAARMLDPDDPLSDAEISQKFHAFADPILGRENAQEIEAASNALDSLSASELGRVLSLVLERPKSAIIADATTAKRGASAVAA